jgi:hypothetical protein
MHQGSVWDSDCEAALEPQSPDGLQHMMTQFLGKIRSISNGISEFETRAIVLRLVWWLTNNGTRWNDSSERSRPLLLDSAAMLVARDISWH